MSYKLTGNIRYREHSRLFRKSLMVLQLEVGRKKGCYVDSYGDTLAPPSWDENEIITYWRDATVEDLAYIKGENK